MNERKTIKIHEKVYDELKKNLRFNESFSDYIYRILRERDEVFFSVRGLLVCMQVMRKSD